jgi:hypothetical protein
MHGISWEHLFTIPKYAKNSRVINVTVRSPQSPQFPHGSIDPIGMESVFTFPNMRKIAVINVTVRSPPLPQFPHGSIDPIGMQSVGSTFSQCENQQSITVTVRSPFLGPSNACLYCFFVQKIAHLSRQKFAKTKRWDYSREHIFLCTAIQEKLLLIIYY